MVRLETIIFDDYWQLRIDKSTLHDPRSRLLRKVVIRLLKCLAKEYTMSETNFEITSCTIHTNMKLSVHSEIMHARLKKTWRMKLIWTRSLSTKLLYLSATAPLDVGANHHAPSPSPPSTDTMYYALEGKFLLFAHCRSQKMA